MGGKLKRAALQFTPYTFDDFNWRAFSTPMRCLESLALVAIFLLLEVGGWGLQSALGLGLARSFMTLRCCVVGPLRLLPCRVCPSTMPRRHTQGQPAVAPRVNTSLLRAGLHSTVHSTPKPALTAKHRLALSCPHIQTALC